MNTIHGKQKLYVYVFGLCEYPAQGTVEYA